jgi:hypothetical protein
MNFLFNFNPIYKCNLTKQTLDFWILCDTKIVSGILILLNSLNSFEVSILSNVTMFSYVFVVSNLLTLSNFANAVWQCNFASLQDVVCREIFSGISMLIDLQMLLTFLNSFEVMILSRMLILTNFLILLNFLNSFKVTNLSNVSMV